MQQVLKQDSAHWILCHRNQLNYFLNRAINRAKLREADYSLFTRAFRILDP